MVEILIPHCIGQHTKTDEQCVGNPKSDDPYEQASCGWLPRCKIFKEHLERTGKSVADYFEAGAGGDDYYAVAKAGNDKFVIFCDALIKAGKRGRKQTARKAKKPKKKTRPKKRGRPALDRRRKGPCAKAKKASRLALQQRRRERMSKLTGLFEQFKDNLAAELGDREFASCNQPIPPGQLYVVDHANTSGYVLIYCKTAKNKDVPVVLLRYKTASLAFNIQFPLEVEEVESAMSAKALKAFQPIAPLSDGRFKSLSTGKVGKQELSMLAEILADMVGSGKIALPAVSE